MTEPAQKRRYPRAKAPKGFVVAWEAGTRRSVSYLANVALGGFFVLTAQPPPVRSTISLLLDAPTGEVRARGVVRRVTPAQGMGIEIIAMNPEDRARLNRFLMPLLKENAA